MGVSESTHWSQRSGPMAKYHALRCDIATLSPSSDEFAAIREHVLDSQHRYSVQSELSL